MSGLSGAPSWSPAASVTTRIPGARQELPAGSAVTSFVPHESPRLLAATTRYV